MRRPRGKSVAIALALGAAAFVAVAGYAARHRILESWHAEFALVDAGMIDLDAARSIVHALPAAEGEGWTRLAHVLERIGRNAVLALEEASERGDVALRRAARVALCIQGRDQRMP